MKNSGLGNCFESLVNSIPPQLPFPRFMSDVCCVHPRDSVLHVRVANPRVQRDGQLLTGGPSKTQERLVCRVSPRAGFLLLEKGKEQPVLRYSNFTL